MAAKKKPKPTAERNSQLIRVLRVLRDLDRLGGVDLYELAERYGTTVRTIRRDLEAIQAAGLPLVEESSGKRKRWRVQFRDHLRKLTDLVDASHYLALRVAMGQGGALRSSGTLFATLEDLSDKIEHVLGDGERRLLATIDDCFYSYEKFSYTNAAPEVLWPLVTAISDKRVCTVVYRAPRATEGKKFRVLPLKLFVHDRALYMHALVLRYDDIVVLNLQRLESLELLEETAEPPKSYDPSKWEGATFGVFGSAPPVQYRLRFSAAAAPYIRERNWHPTQKLRKMKKGIELSFTCSESPEVTSWVASWRREVTVLEPESLRRELAETGAWLQEQYR